MTALQRDDMLAKVLGEDKLTPADIVFNPRIVVLRVALGNTPPRTHLHAEILVLEPEMGNHAVPAS